MRVGRWVVAMLVVALAAGAGLTSVGGATSPCRLKEDFDGAHALAVQPDGRVIVAGAGRSELALVRYRTDGSLDSTFGRGGIVHTNLGRYERVTGLVIDRLGRIIAAGSVDKDGGLGLGLVRYTPDGRLDATFAGDGTVVEIDPSSMLFVYDVALAPDGRIVVAGTANRRAVLLRYLDDGSPDFGFGREGRATTPVGPLHGLQVAVAPSGQILVGGGLWTGEGKADFAVLQFASDGSPDGGFGGDGIALTDLGGEDVAFGLEQDGAGRAVIAGYSAGKRYWEDSAFAVVRHRSDGQADVSFGDNGVVLSKPSGADFGHALALQTDGRIILAGNTRAGLPRSRANFGVVRFHDNGRMDTAFGQEGLAATDFGGSDYARAVGVLPDGGIVAAGTSDQQPSGSDFAVARYLADGTPDRRFGVDGRVLTDVSGLVCIESLARTATGENR